MNGSLFIAFVTNGVVASFSPISVYWNFTAFPRALLVQFRFPSAVKMVPNWSPHYEWSLIPFTGFFFADFIMRFNLKHHLPSDVDSFGPQGIPTFFADRVKWLLLGSHWLRFVSEFIFERSSPHFQCFFSSSLLYWVLLIYFGCKEPSPPNEVYSRLLGFTGFPWAPLTQFRFRCAAKWFPSSFSNTIDPIRGGGLFIS